MSDFPLIACAACDTMPVQEPGEVCAECQQAYLDAKEER